MEPKDAESTPGADSRGEALPITGLPFPALKLAPDGVVLASNGVLEREWQLGEPLPGHPLADVIQPHTARPLAALLHDPARGHLTLIPRGGGSGRSFAVIPDGGALWLVGAPAADDEQRTAAIADAAEAKTRFLATMSHELRTPLNAVLGYAGLMRDGVYGPMTEPQDRAVRSIVRRARDLQLLIDDVLDLSRIEAGRAELRWDTFEPAEVLAEVREAVTPFAQDKGLTIQGRASFRDAVRLDRGKYKQVVLNLATNAVKFTPERGLVELSLERGPGEGGTFVTRIRDTGIGIAPHDLERIFEDFQQLDSGSTRRYQGLGIGLPIVRRIVELLGGSIAVESDPGRGTTFRVTLPTRPAEEMLFEAADARAPGVAHSDDPIVVAIDDDPEVIALLRDSLAPAHFRVVGALTGDRGKELARILRPLAITLDIMMPGKDGWQVLREIKADPELAQIPVIAMSIVSERTLGVSLGVTDYLVKPVDRGLLIDVLGRLRARHALHPPDAAPSS